MRKSIFLLSMFFAFGMGAHAVPAKPGVKKTLTLADGTTVCAELKGDEFMSWWESADGRKFVLGQGDTQHYVAADMTALREIADAKRRPVEANRAKRLAPSRAASTGSRVIGGEHTTYTGTKKGLVILVEFKNKKFETTHDLDYYKNVINGINFSSDEGYVGSVRDYFRAQSNNTFDIDFDVVGPIQLSHNYSYYGNDYSSSYRDVKAGTMIKEACTGADKYVDYADYDWDGDGEVDQVFVLYAGMGQASGGDDATIWPHEYQLQYCSDVGKKLTFDGVYVDTYACGNELEGVVNSTTGSYTGETKPSGIGTICHEFSHCLGFPDMYDTSGGNNYAMGFWDVMASGSYNGSSYIPCNYTSYERMYAGWTDPIVLDSPASVLKMRSITDNGRPFILYNEKNNDEFYLLENRQQEGWDAALYGAGMLILHVDYDADVWQSNNVNATASRQRCTIFHADNETGSSYLASIQGDPYPYMVRNTIVNDELTDDSEPAATLNTRNSDGTKKMGKPITDIRINSDGTMKFNVLGGSDDNILENDYVTAISDIHADRKQADGRIYTIDGRYAGKDASALGSGIYIVNGKKYVK